MGTLATTGSPHLFEAPQAQSQQGLENPVRPQEGQVVEVSGWVKFLNGVDGMEGRESGGYDCTNTQ
jgi:hypothetical protein